MNEGTASSAARSYESVLVVPAPSPFIAAGAAFVGVAAVLAASTMIALHFAGLVSTKSLVWAPLLGFLAIIAVAVRMTLGDAVTLRRDSISVRSKLRRSRLIHWSDVRSVVWTQGSTGGRVMWLKCGWKRTVHIWPRERAADAFAFIRSCASRYSVPIRVSVGSGTLPEWDRWIDEHAHAQFLAPAGRVVQPSATIPEARIQPRN